MSTKMDAIIKDLADKKDVDAAQYETVFFHLPLSTVRLNYIAHFCCRLRIIKVTYTCAKH